MGRGKFLGIAFLCHALLFINYASSDNLEDFVRLKMSNYSTWLTDNKLDPSPAAAGPIHLNSSSHNEYTLDCYLRNHMVRGHSAHINVNSVNASLPGGRFDVLHHMTENITFYGEYKANGTVYSGNGSAIPVNVEGMWHVEVQSVAVTDFYIFFDVFSNKSLYFAGYKLFHPIELEGSPELHFNNLFDNEALEKHKEKVAGDFYEGFRYLGVDHPLGLLYIEYWQEILPKATWKDIIGTEVNAHDPKR